MMTSSARDRARAALLGVDRLHIFVPAIMSVGLLFWLASELRELLRSSDEASRAKRAGIAGHAVARMTTATRAPDNAAALGLRPRPVYLLIALTLAGGALYVTIGSVANFFQQPGWVADIAWLLSLSLAVAVGAAGDWAGAAPRVVRVTKPPARPARGVANNPV
ncbi:hypothetical protein, partial [Nocardia neocaledoniensis]|uniref:hypothetical protein n=1 Tax=Nocardia neocaledoniensis TaxID=236511 RepID=UPI002457CC29